MSILDMRAETVADRLWLVTNKDGSKEIVADSELNGRGGFAPAYGRPYREVLAEFLASAEKESANWLALYQAIQRGVHDITGPLTNRKLRGLYFIAGGTAYKAFVGTHHTGNFLGFGGALVTITPASGAPIESNNAWFIDKVPPHLRGLLPDTATMEWKR